MGAEFVTEDHFDLLRVEAIRGRTFLPEEHADADAFPVAVISHGQWERRYGSDPNTFGGSITLNDRLLTVVGTLPESFGGTNLNTDVWVPESMISLTAGAGIVDARDARFLSVLGRLTPGSTLDHGFGERGGPAPRAVSRKNPGDRAPACAGCAGPCATSTPISRCSGRRP